MPLDFIIPSGGVDVTRRNGRDVLYIKGTEFTDGSIRLIVLPGESLAEIEFRNDGVWNDTQFRVDLLHLGRDLSIKPAAGFLETNNPTNIVGTFRSLIPHIVFDATGTGHPELPVLDAKQNIPVFINPTGEEVGTLIDQGFSFATESRMIDQATFLAGATAATQPVIFTIYEGLDNTGFIKERFELPISDFVASMPVEVIFNDSFGSGEGQNFFIEFESAGVFSLQTDISTNIITTFSGHELRTLEILALNMIMKNDAGQVVKNDGNFVLKDYFEAAA